MIDTEEQDRIMGEIGKLFEGLELNDVAAIMTMQLAVIAAQGGDKLDDAVAFLDEMRDEAEVVLGTIDFDDVAEEKQSPPDTTD